MTSPVSMPDAGAANATQAGSRAKGAGRNGSSSDGSATAGFRDVLANLDGDQRTSGKDKSQDASARAKLSVLAGRVANGGLADESTDGGSEPGEPDAEGASGDKPGTPDVALLAQIWPSIQRTAQPAEGNPGSEKNGEAPLQVLPDDAELEARLPAGRAKVSVTHQEVHFEPGGMTETTRTVAEDQAAKPAASEGAATLAAMIGGTAASSRKAGSAEASDPRRSPESTALETDASSASAIEATAVGETKDGDQGAMGTGARNDRHTVTGSASLDVSSAMSTPQPLTQQIADRVTAEMAGIESLSQAPATSATTTSIAPQGTVLKVLHIKLEPENLGTVTVRLSLKDDALEMQLEASRPETADMLTRDRDALSNLMRSAGYAIDTTAVSTAARSDSGSNANSGNPQTGPQSQGDSSSQSQQGSADSGRRGNDARDQQQHGAARTTDSEIHETGNRSRGSGTIYV